MKPKQTLVLISLTFLLASVVSCTTKSWYEGAKQGAENNCRSQPPSEIESCLESLNKKTYEDYEKERSGK